MIFNQSHDILDEMNDQSLKHLVSLELTAFKALNQSNANTFRLSF